MQAKKPKVVTVNFPLERSLETDMNVKLSMAVLKAFYDCHILLMHCMSGWIIKIEEFEIKVECAHHIFYHSLAAKRLSERLLDLGLQKTELYQSNNRLNTLIEEVKTAQSISCFLSGVYLVILTSLIQAERQYLLDASHLLDMPSIYCIKHILVDMEEALEWGLKICRAYKSTDQSKRNQVEQWVQHLNLILQAIGGIIGKDQNPQVLPMLIHQYKPFIRPVAYGRDARFKTFSHTRNYKELEALLPNESDEYLKELFCMICIQRDEIDAFETFADVLYDLGNQTPLELQFDLARFIWDEARHAEIGHKSLEKLGIDPFEVPCSTIGIKVRSSMPPAAAFAQISIFGELNIVTPIRCLSQKGFGCCDKSTGITFDYILADELLHLKKGRKWVQFLHGGKDMALIQEETRIAAAKRLVEEGVFNEEYAMNLTSKQISDILGE